MAQANESRRFIRHSLDVPIEIGRVAAPVRTPERGTNISFGGLSFVVAEPVAVGEILEIRIPTVQPPFEARSRVVWCHPEADQYRVGVAFFDSNDAFQARMVEQVCEIDAYRREAQQQGRSLTTSEAAAEWIQKFAGRFPREDSE